MTAIDALVAEAIAKAEKVTPKLLGDHGRVRLVDENGDLVDRGYFDRVNDARAPRGLDEGDCTYVRRDVVDAALAHLATRAAEAEEKLGIMTLSRLEVMARTEEAMEQTDKALANTAKAIASLEAAVAAGSAWKAKAAEAEGRAERAEARLRVMRDNVNSIRHTTHDAKSIGDATRANAMAIDTLARDAKLAGEDAASKAYLPWTEAGGPDECAHGYADGIPCPECDKAKVAPGEDCRVCGHWVYEPKANGLCGECDQ